MRRQLCASLIAVAIASLLAQGIAAAEPQVITLSPTSVDTSVVPGQAKHGSFQVINQGKTDYDFDVYAAPYRIKGEDYTPDFTKLPTAPDITSWFQFTTTHAHIKPNDSLTVGYTISVPAATLPGDYYAAAFAQTHTPSPTNSAVILNERVGELFYLQVPGKKVEKGSIAQWNVKFLQQKPLTSILRISNQGAVHYTANVQIVVQDALGHPKYTLKTDKVILPQTIRQLTVPWTASPSLGLFKVTGSVTYLGKTEALPTHYVMLASNNVRYIGFSIVGLLTTLLLFAVVSQLIHRGKRPQKPKSEK